jgi:methionine-rich copper-binding protein CopC
VSIIIKEEKNVVEDYLLGRLKEEDEERLELRLLTDPAFGEEFDTVVDEITDQYARNEFQGEERKRVEQYFLRSAERQNKVRFASELLRQAAAQRGSKVVNAPIPSEPGLWERARLFWNAQALSLRFATIFATLVILVGLAMLLLPTRNPPAYASIALKVSNADRSVGSEITSVKPQPADAGIRIELTLPEGAPQAKSYRVSLSNEQASRDLPVAEQNARSIVVIVPTAELPPGSYSIRLFGVNADGAEQRVRGSYFFNVE